MNLWKGECEREGEGKRLVGCLINIEEWRGEEG